MKNILEAIKRGIYDPTFNDELEKLRNQKNQLSLSINQESACLKEIKQVKETDVKQSLEHFSRFVKERNIEECKRFIRSFVDKVIVYRDYIEVVFKISFLFDNDGIDYQDLAQIYRDDLIATYGAIKKNNDKKITGISPEYILDYEIKPIKLDVNREMT